MTFLNHLGNNTLFLLWEVYKKILKLLCYVPFFESTLKRYVRYKLSRYGINVNGTDPWDPQIHNEEWYYRVASDYSLGVGETYMEEMFTVKDMCEFARRIFRSRGYYELHHPLSWLPKYFNLQSPKYVWEVGKLHYDAGNDFYERIFDKYMNYTNGYWKNAKNLQEAQIQKLEILAQNLQLKPGMRVLDIGCGWGGLAKYFATNYGVSVVGCTISEEQVKYGRKMCEGLPVEIRFADYREMNEKFDRIVSVEMFEHTGTKNHRTYMEVVNRCLVDDGIFLLQTIGISHPDMPGSEPFFQKYFFPYGWLSNYMEICNAINGLFVIEDWHVISFDYLNTLDAWYANLLKSKQWIIEKYGKKFFLMWEYYLVMAKGTFKARKMNNWQIVLSKNGLDTGYRATRL